VRALRRGEPVRLRHPHAVRPWQHVLDALSGYLALATRLLEGDGAAHAEAWNFGPDPGPPVTVAALTERLLRAWPGGGSWVPAPDPAAPPEVAHLALDNAKAKARLGWSPVWTTDEAVEATAAWYGERAPSMRAFTVGQIEAYSRRAAVAHAR
jgi:CDP-glucose 4,6-dehydratase